MKKTMFLLSVLGLNSAWAGSAFIRDGKYNEELKAIELNVTYGGGCKEHKFHLEIGSCLESYPVQCNDIQLVDETQGDHCRAMISKKVILTLEETGLNNPYYNGASLTINSSGSKAQIKLPFNQ